MDILSRALSDKRLRGSLLAMLDFSDPWRVDFETAPSGAPMHYIIEGYAWLERPNLPAIRLGPGDLVMFPRWDRHWLRSADGHKRDLTVREVVRLNEGDVWAPGQWLDRPLKLSLKGGNDRTRILSLVFELDESTPHPLLLGLPRYIHLDAADTGMERWLRMTLDFLSEESEQQQSGYAVVSSRLADLVFMQILRSHILRHPDQVAGWLRALVDPGIGAALAVMHDRPEDDWPLHKLAKHSGMSRSTFCSKFKYLVGQTPYNYLRIVRLERAKEQLIGGERIKSLISQAGYSTHYAFSKAFRDHFGISPQKMRGNRASHRKSESED
ncbi:AraC family transcriptional regulator [Nitrospirillum iridis]|uniref:AraC-like DNA-binding protein n=1 Tax=Nitrospirillum iridis TaxID=765888 RepID=A0A7X0B657_9PROT|nr:AraC family transcriptional regulator [Nitrospirillum iridis]MBB6255171.1 AraC-like DNA-binding protein [Nitrospirillum iridis]